MSLRASRQAAAAVRTESSFVYGPRVLQELEGGGAAKFSKDIDGLLPQLRILIL